MTDRLMSSDPTPPIHSIVDKDDGTSWYRGTDGLWFCISKDHNEEGVRWEQLAEGRGVTVVRYEGRQRL